MARVLHEATTTLYRTLVKHDNLTSVFGPYDSKAINRNYRWDSWDTRVGHNVYKQELKPVFHLTPDKGLVLGLEWVSYEINGVKVHEH